MSADTNVRSSAHETEQEAGSGFDRSALIRMLIVVSGMFMITLDFFVVNVAIPSTRADLHASAAAVEFIVSGFSLAYAASMLTAGRLGDLYGRRRMFACGMILFTLASLIAGMAPSAGVLMAARVVQGIGAAVMTPQMLAILNTSFTGEQRVRAFTAFALSMGVGATFGQLIGGALIHLDIAGLGWRTIFLINVPIGVTSLLLMRSFIPESHGGGRSELDLIGALLGSAGLLAIVFPLVEGREQGWPAWSWVCLAAALPLLGAFAVRQHRLERQDRAPLISLTLFRERAFSVGIVIILGFFAAMASFMLVLALYLQDGHGLSALGSGAVFGALGIGYVPAAFAAPKLAVRLGRQVLTLGALVVAAGYGLLIVTVSQIGTTGPSPWMMPGLFVAGVGMALFANPVTPTVLAGVSPHHAAAAAGVLSTAQEGGNALGVAAIGVVFFGVLGHGHSGSYAHAFEFSVAVLAAFTVAAAVLVQALPKASAPA
ncbi:MFS transporter [Streptomyces alanosinicus]|uniref:MFS transporter n=1 Tax=Streptomyces alanosinicus TaxID=68171 RepID=A0A918YVQ0_9ACTN|nr:MFS transporter [Streptomyces alanosinicus]GHE15613.1 MFS transporter [Streptomyces alanosinicus]